jgi:hypothetical protein
LRRGAIDYAQPTFTHGRERRAARQSRHIGTDAGKARSDKAAYGAQSNDCDTHGLVTS